MRKRINTKAICSSENYEVSRRISTSAKDRINENKKPFTKVWGKLIPLTDSEAKMAIDVIWM